jgi:hypothetical protein
VVCQGIWVVEVQKEAVEAKNRMEVESQRMPFRECKIKDKK